RPAGRASRRLQGRPAGAATAADLTAPQTTHLVDDAVLDVRDRWRGDYLDRFNDRLADVLEQPLACPEDDRNDVEVGLVEHPGGEVLPHGTRAAGDRYVPVVSRRPGLLQRGLDAVGDEHERRAALHRQRLARVMGEHEDGRVEGRVLTPPARPRLVPHPVAAAEHLAAHDVGADTLDDFVDDLRVNGALASV